MVSIVLGDMLSLTQAQLLGLVGVKSLEDDI